MIPKVIHYCWFGCNPKSDIVKKCIASWHKYCPGWKIKEWNEHNYDITKSAFMEEAYRAKRYAFVSDYARLDIIFNCGGVYLDTDVELFASLDGWLNYEAFFVFETGRNINTGMGFAACMGSPAVEKMLNFYNGRHYIENGREKIYPCPKNNTESFCDYCKEFRRNGETQVIGNSKVISLPEYSKIAKHHFTGTWGDDKEPRKSHGYHDTRGKRFIRKPSHFIFVEKHFGKKAIDIYTFYCYDLQEYGVKHFLKRMSKRGNEDG